MIIKMSIPHEARKMVSISHWLPVSPNFIIGLVSVVLIWLSRILSHVFV